MEETTKPAEHEEETIKTVENIGMKKKLEALPKVKIKIPIDKQNPKDLDVTVQINGYTYLIKRGEEVNVPRVVKEILENAKYI